MALETVLNPSALLGWAYHLSYFFGSVSVGYLLLRLTYPDIRIIDKNKSLGISFVLGAAVYVFAQATSEGISWVSGISGLLPGIILAYSAVGFLLLKIYFYFTTPSLLTIGVPIHSVSIAAKAMNEPEPASVKAQQINSDEIPSWIKSSKPAQQGPGSKIYISEKSISSEKEAGIGSSYFGQHTQKTGVASEGPSKVPIPQMRPPAPEKKKTESPSEEEEDINDLMYGKAAIKAPSAPRKDAVAQEKEDMPKEQKNVVSASQPEKKAEPAVSAAQVTTAPQTPSKPAKAGFFDGLIAAFSFGGKAKQQGSQQKPMLPATVPGQNSISQLLPEKAGAIPGQNKQGYKATPLPKIQAPGATQQAPPWILRNQKQEKGTQEPAPADKQAAQAGTSKEAETQAQSAAQPNNENLPPTITLDVIPRKKDGSAAKGGSKIAPELLAPKGSPAQQSQMQGVREVSVGEEQLMGEAKKHAGENEKAGLIELEVPIKQSDMEQRPRMFTAVGEPGEARKTIRRAKEAEAEIILDDIMPQIEKQNRRIRETDYDNGDSQNANADGQQSSMPRHRMYAQDQDSIRVVAPKEVMESGEFGEIINDVYGQLKNTSGKPSGQFVNTPPKPSVTSDKGVKVLSDPDASKSPAQFSDIEKELFGKDEAAPKPASGTTEGQGLFDQLNTINTTGGMPPGAKQPIKTTSDVEFVHIQGAKGLGCPNCHQNNSRIVFCPYCGSGMCANCSPNVRMEPDGFAYICPKCGEEVHIKKKAAA